MRLSQLELIVGTAAFFAPYHEPHAAKGCKMRVASGVARAPTTVSNRILGTKPGLEEDVEPRCCDEEEAREASLE
jgi:hypothetical protein